MCGIFGGTGISLDQANDAIKLIRRGDDGITLKKLDNGIIFAARRHLVKKSGKDTKAHSDQPYFSEDQNISLIFNGEFFNYLEFKNFLLSKKIGFSTTGDTEVFLKLYETKGIDFLYDKNIDSLFSLAIYDKKKDKIYVTRDWPGRIPVYYYHNEKDFIFSSELKAFKAIKNISLQDPIELEPGFYIEFDCKTKKLKKIKYYKLINTHIPKDTGILDIGKKLDEVLDKSAKNRTMGDVPICTMLSGGIDSVLTTFYVFKNLDFEKMNYQPTSYVFSVKNFNSPDVQKARIARDSFSTIGLKLIEVEAESKNIIDNVANIIETFEMRKMKALSFYPLPIYWYLAPKMKEQGFKVTIGGHGVDELLGAYDSWKELNKPHEVQIRSASRIVFINNIYSNMLKRASIIFMNRGPIEARFPFLNHKVCEFMLSIDKKWLHLNKENAKVLINLIDRNKNEKLSKIHGQLDMYINNPEKIDEKISPDELRDLKKIFWKFPLIVSSYFASENSFLKFDQVFNPKLRGQHGAGITSLEKDVVNKYAELGNTDTEIFKKMAHDIFK